MWWQKRLGELRREERPSEAQPVLQLPLPESEPLPETEPLPEGDRQGERGIAVIDFTF